MASIRCSFWSRRPAIPKPIANTNIRAASTVAPIELFKSDVTGLLLPADAEIIVEGYRPDPDETFAEGPFGEFTGYYGRPSGATPYMRVEAVRFRNNPTLTCA